MFLSLLLSGQIARRSSFVVVSMGPKIHVPSTMRPRLYLRRPILHSSISTTWFGPPILPLWTLANESVQTSLEYEYQSAIVASDVVHSGEVVAWSRACWYVIFFGKTICQNHHLLRRKSDVFEPGADGDRLVEVCLFEVVMAAAEASEGALTGFRCQLVATKRAVHSSGTKPMEFNQDTVVSVYVSILPSRKRFMV